MADQPNKEFQDFFISVSKLREHLAAGSDGTALVNDSLNKLCPYYNSDPVARAGPYVIENTLGLHPHLHCTEKRGADWGFEGTISSGSCGQQETHRVVAHA